jgi:hypothetical protein
MNSASGRLGSGVGFSKRVDLSVKGVRNSSAELVCEREELGLEFLESERVNGLSMLESGRDNIFDLVQNFGPGEQVCI